MARTIMEKFMVFIELYIAIFVTTFLYIFSYFKYLSEKYLIIGLQFIILYLILDVIYLITTNKMCKDYIGLALLNYYNKTKKRCKDCIGLVLLNYRNKKRLNFIRNIIKKQLRDDIHFVQGWSRNEYETNLINIYQSIVLRNLEIKIFNFNSQFDINQNILNDYIKMLIYKYNIENKIQYVENIIELCEYLNTEKSHNYIEYVIDMIIQENKKMPDYKKFLIEYLKKTNSRRSFKENMRIIDNASLFCKGDISELIICLIKPFKNDMTHSYIMNSVIIMENCSNDHERNNCLNYMRIFLNSGVKFNLGQDMLTAISIYHTRIERLPRYCLDEKVIKFCLANGADLEEKNSSGLTILSTELFYSTSVVHIPKYELRRIKLLIDHGAKLDNYIEKRTIKHIDPRVVEYCKITPTQVWKNNFLTSIYN